MLLIFDDHTFEATILLIFRDDVPCVDLANGSDAKQSEVKKLQDAVMEEEAKLNGQRGIEERKTIEITCWGRMGKLFSQSSID
ncbi:Hypothetical predicted protein [Olea europaea subsp. europaea]|uniref:Uncharacterized protein n=1 Tax=Olea europaea subsp. europaea TaxID=158383 RepID=A0A8S0TCG1_OLEEU|nr:Hypothetical predicted protein [Olea europaea subsp. europaea]